VNYGTITGLAPATIAFQQGPQSDLQINGGSGGNTFTVDDSGGGGGHARARAFAAASSGSSDMQRNIVLGPGDDLLDLTDVQEVLTVDGGGGNDTVAGPDAPTTYTLTGLNSGTIMADTFGATVTFSNLENVTGGAVDNTLVFGNGNGITGRFVGGNGMNTLDYHLYTTTVEVVLPLDVATGIGDGVTGITKIIGGHDGGPGTYNLLVGMNGSTLIGGNGRPNVLIAGNEPSYLAGGNGRDILIGGQTGHDTNLDHLEHLAQAWAGADSFDAGVAQISMSGTTYHLGSDNVTSNIAMYPGEFNTFTGTGTYWIFADPSHDNLAVTPALLTEI
jgi:hypothetical protein